jgi:hypothetical protein
MRLGLATFVPLGLLAASSDDAQEAYEGRIDGEYNGWTGETVYKPALFDFVQLRGERRIVGQLELARSIV